MATRIRIGVPARAMLAGWYQLPLFSCIGCQLRAIVKSVQRHRRRKPAPQPAIFALMPKWEAS